MCYQLVTLTTHNTHNRQTSMPPVGFEPTISAGERPQTHALDRAATGIGTAYISSALISKAYLDTEWHLRSTVTAVTSIVSAFVHSVKMGFVLFH